MNLPGLTEDEQTSIWTLLFLLIKVSLFLVTTQVPPPQIKRKKSLPWNECQELLWKETKTTPLKSLL